MKTLTLTKRIDKVPGYLDSRSKVNTWNNWINHHLSHHLSQPTHLGTQPKTTTRMDRELTIHLGKIVQGQKIVSKFVQLAIARPEVCNLFWCAFTLLSLSATLIYHLTCSSRQIKDREGYVSYQREGEWGVLNPLDFKNCDFGAFSIFKVLIYLIIFLVPFSVFKISYIC